MFPNRPGPELVEAVVKAEELDLDEIWLADEGIARDPMVVLAAAARETSRITLATGVTSPLLRHPGSLAAAAATLDEISGGRFRLGLGIGGVKSLGPFGLVAERPVGALRDAIATVPAVLAVEKGHGYQPADHAFGPRSVEVWVGARGPKMIAMAADVADGVFLSGCSPEQHDEIIGRARLVNSEIGTALYQSASDLVNSPTVCSWAEVSNLLAGEWRRFRPTSIGINLVDLMSGDTDAGAAVERAADVLHQIG